MRPARIRFVSEVWRSCGHGNSGDCDKQDVVRRGTTYFRSMRRNVSDAYRYSMNVFEEGDQVYLFGFSGGAFTARALAGVLHMFGLLCPGNEGLIPYVIRIFAHRTRKAKGMTLPLQ